MPRLQFIDESRKNALGYDNCEGLSVDDLKLGCLMRIANAVEVMSKNYQQLVDDLNYYKNKSTIGLRRLSRETTRLQVCAALLNVSKTRRINMPTFKNHAEKV